MEVLKKMMHHHTLTPLCVSAEGARERVSVLSSQKLRVGRAGRGTRVRRGSARESADGTVK